MNWSYDNVHACIPLLTGANSRSSHRFVQDTKAANEMAALRDWYAMLSQDSSRAFYGPGHVFAAHELGAIQTLLLSDNLFRINNVAKVKALLSVLLDVMCTTRCGCMHMSCCWPVYTCGRHENLCHAYAITADPICCSVVTKMLLD